jgi:C_GCAxxG_C_C family probable redox protein
MLAVGEHLLGKVSSDTFKLASIFAGGLAGTRQELCGALSGGAMVVGALYGRTRPGEDFRDRFLAEFGTTQCAPLRQRYEMPGKTGFCAPVAERAVAILLEVLSGEGQ